MKIRYPFLFLNIIFFSLFCSCGLESGSDVSAEDGKIPTLNALGLSMLNPPKDLANLKDDEDLTRVLGYLDWDFPLNAIEEDDKEEATGWFDKCLKRFFGEKKIKAIKNSAQFAASIRVNKDTCKNELEGEDDNNTDFIIDMDILLYGKISCDHANLSKFDGLSLNDSSLESVFSNCKESSLISRIFRSKFTYTRLVDSGDYKLFVTDESIDIQNNSKGEPCEWTSVDKVWTTKDCFFVNKTETKDVKEVGEKPENFEFEAIGRSYVRSDLRGLSGKIDTKFYTEGKSSIQVNNWTGHAEFDGSNKFKWKLSRGENTKSGLFDMEID